MGKEGKLRDKKKDKERERDWAAEGNTMRTNQLVKETTIIIISYFEDTAQ